jgi:hypothetical protein
LEGVISILPVDSFYLVGSLILICLLDVGVDGSYDIFTILNIKSSFEF